MYQWNDSICCVVYGTCMLKLSHRIIYTMFLLRVDIDNIIYGVEGCGYPGHHRKMSVFNL